ncbi:hypothetical protein [Clostridium amazonitimonense]|uniref:hypothetical protein n=1 Tax=Clostridium amazonitimonense TaxID=1499689 RepID=UPI0005099C84|nr:hypothetical protein [Clostridium amazonitimonense]
MKKNIFNFKLELKSKKKAFSILEFIIYFSISITIIHFLFTIIIISLKDYKESNKSYVNYIYLNQAIDIIDRELNSGRMEVIVQDNFIWIKEKDFKPNTSIEKYIMKNDKDRIVAVIKKNNIVQTSNNIIKNVEEFYAEKNQDLIFIKIVLKGGDFIEKCYAVNSG